MGAHGVGWGLAPLKNPLQGLHDLLDLLKTHIRKKR
jgi:hypothetical protein